MNPPDFNCRHCMSACEVCIFKSKLILHLPIRCYWLITCLWKLKSGVELHSQPLSHRYYKSITSARQVNIHYIHKRFMYNYTGSDPIKLTIEFRNTETWHNYYKKETRKLLYSSLAVRTYQFILRLYILFISGMNKCTVRIMSTLITILTHIKM